MEALPRRIIKASGGSRTSRCCPRSLLASLSVGAGRGARQGPTRLRPSLSPCPALLQETQRLLSEPVPGISAAPSEDNLVSSGARRRPPALDRWQAAALVAPAGPGLTASDGQRKERQPPCQRIEQLAGPAAAPQHATAAASPCCSVIFM